MVPRHSRARTAPSTPRSRGSEGARRCQLSWRPAVLLAGDRAGGAVPLLVPGARSTARGGWNGAWSLVTAGGGDVAGGGQLCSPCKGCGCWGWCCEHVPCTGWGGFLWLGSWSSCSVSGDTHTGLPPEAALDTRCFQLRDPCDPCSVPPLLTARPLDPPPEPPGAGTAEDPQETSLRGRGCPP